MFDQAIYLHSVSKPAFYAAVQAWPFAIYKNIFTGDSNIPEPVKLLSLLNEALELIKKIQSSSSTNLPDHLKIPEKLQITNLYSQLYPKEGKTIHHIDGYLNWVVSLSLGESCKFAWGDTKTKLPHCTDLSSGDLILINGGKVFHTVAKVHIYLFTEFPSRSTLIQLLIGGRIVK